MSDALLFIHGDLALTPGRFLVLNIALVVGICTLYGAYLVLLVRKRMRAGAYGAFPRGE